MCKKEERTCPRIRKEMEEGGCYQWKAQNTKANMPVKGKEMGEVGCLTNGESIMLEITFERGDMLILVGGNLRKGKKRPKLWLTA